MFLILTSSSFSATVEITGRAEFNFTITPDLRTSSSNWLAYDNAAYLVAKSGNVVMVVDMKYTAPRFTDIYINEFFAPWRANNNLTVFFGYRNVADYDGFMGPDGTVKWAYNGVGILWYKTVLSAIYAVPNLMLDFGTSFKNPLDFVVLAETSISNFTISANVSGNLGFTEGVIGSRITFRLLPYHFDLAAGFDYLNLILKGLLFGFRYQSGNVKAAIELDATNFQALKVSGKFSYKLQNWTLGVSGTYDFGVSSFVVEPYGLTNLDRIELKPSVKITENGVVNFNVSATFNF